MGTIDSIEKNIKILVVDDYPLTRNMVKAILRQVGFSNVLTVEDGSQALEVLNREPVELVICDWNMPKMSGLEVLQEVRMQDRYKNLPFLMLTAEAYRENVVEAQKAGVSGYVVKPFTAQTLLEKIESILGAKLDQQNPANDPKKV